MRTMSVYSTVHHMSTSESAIISMMMQVTCLTCHV